MDARRILLLALVASLPLSAQAQLDDFLEPLTEEPKKGKKKGTQRRARPPAANKAEPSGDALLEPLVQKGELLVKVSGPADGAQVSVDGQEVRAGQRVEVDPGEHTVTVRRPGWADFSRKVKVAPGQKLEVPAALDPVAGVLAVVSDVPGSAVLLDGKPLGTSPLSGVVVPPGMREVVVRHEGFEDHVSRLSIRAGRDYTVQSRLRPQETTRTLAAVDADRPEARRLVPDATATPAVPLGVTEDAARAPSWYGRWYVWAGVGAAAVAVTSAVLVANSSNNGPRGPSPSDVCRGECDSVMNAPKAIVRF
jgi:hypothetical protein